MDYPSASIPCNLTCRVGASSLHQIGNLHYIRGSYAEALAHYERSLKIKEERRQPPRHRHLPASDRDDLSGTRFVRRGAGAL